MTKFSSLRTLPALRVMLVAACLGGSMCLSAQPTRVKDISPGNGDSNPSVLTNVNGTLYFGARSGNTHALYKSNGTDGGTVRLKTFASAPSHITHVNGVVYFSADDGQHGRELWRSDGTPEGTQLVKDLRPGSASTEFVSLAAVRNTLYFSDNSPKLWKSDGTANGTVVVANEFPCYGLTEYNNTLYFIYGGLTPMDGRGIGKSDGTAGGTTVVKQLLNETQYGGGIFFLKEADGVLYTVVGAGDAPVSYSLWRSNGTESGTTLVSSIWEGSRRSRLQSYCFSGSTLYFSAEEEPAGYDPKRGLYKFDLGSMIREQLANTQGTNHYYTDLTHVGGTLYYVKVGLSGRTLLRRNGSEGIALPGFAAANPANLTPVSGTLYFTAKDGAGNELWKFNPAAPMPDVFRVDVGGSDYTSRKGNRFDEDGYATGGRLTRSVEGDVANTDDDKLYRRGRYGADFSYTFPTGNGYYDVTLHFNETYWGNLARGGAGSRRFNVDVEGDRKLTEYDIFVRAGGTMKAVQETFRVRVTDGQLSIRFARGSNDYARVEAIEVERVQATFYRAINLNGNGLTLDGNAWQGSSVRDYTTNGQRMSAGGVPLKPATGAARTSMIQSSVWHPNALTVAISKVPDGRYQVFVYTWEDNEPQTYSLRVENKTVHPDYHTGTPGTWKKHGPYETTITDGSINVAALGGTANFSGIEIWRVEEVSSGRVVANQAAGSDDGLHAFPNPSRDRLFVQTVVPVAQVQSTQVADPQGKVYLTNWHRPAGEQSLEIDVSTLKEGLYFLRVQTSQGSRSVKFRKE
jgi:ELWxxDGT repeat protein